MKVLDKTNWTIAVGGGGYCPAPGLEGQVTKCEHEGVVFYMRENITAVSSFNMSSGERWGIKIGKSPSPSRQSLELAAPPDKCS